MFETSVRSNSQASQAIVNANNDIDINTDLVQAKVLELCEGLNSND